MLRSKRLLITGLVTTDSIAFAVAERAQLHGADVVLTAYGRDVGRCEEAARLLPHAAPVLELDLTSPEQVAEVTDVLRDRYGQVDGALHAVAFAPRDALGGTMLDVRPEAVELAFRTSVFSLAHLAQLVRDLSGPGGASIVGLDFDDGNGGAWPIYNWMGVCKAALRSTTKYLARDLGERGIRVNLVAAGPLHTRAGTGIPGFEHLTEAWEDTAPLGWDPDDPGSVADTTCFLLADGARMVTGEVLHVDGGYHAMASPVRAAMRREAAR